MMLDSKMVMGYTPWKRRCSSWIKNIILALFAGRSFWLPSGGQKLSPAGLPVITKGRIRPVGSVLENGMILDLETAQSVARNLAQSRIGGDSQGFIALRSVNPAKAGEIMQDDTGLLIPMLIRLIGGGYDWMVTGSRHWSGQVIVVNYVDKLRSYTSTIKTDLGRRNPLITIWTTLWYSVLSAIPRSTKSISASLMGSYTLPERSLM
tara:strand:+ start:3589 stop:4209 length:621 start_codon:yes stop_codon:yes gene_type:complete